MTSRDVDAMLTQNIREGEAELAAAGELRTLADLAPTLMGVPLTDDEARELSRAARQVTSWTERRNKLIRDAYERGAGIREIAKATGLNSGTVHTMLHGRKR